MKFLVVDPRTIPLELLLLADPSEKQIQTYLQSSQAIAAMEAKRIIGVILVRDHSPIRGEIVNLAVFESWQNKGIGKQLIQQAITHAKSRQLRELQIKTANSSIGQLAMYQKIGFQMKELDLNYFVRNYPEPIWENGIQCRHRVILHMDLT